MFNNINKTEAYASLQSLEDALTLCRTSGMRISQQRYRVLELLWQTNEHLSAKEIYARLNQHALAVSLTAIYQNIAALSALGLLESIPSSKGHLYSKVGNSHAHVKCLDTEKILDVKVNLPKSSIDKVMQEVEQHTGIHIVDYQFDFFGYEKL